MPSEIIDIALMSVATAYIFLPLFRKNKELSIKRAYLLSLALVSSAIVLHELAHMVSAWSLGLQADFHAACSTSSMSEFLSWPCILMGLAIALRIAGLNTLFFVPGFVAVPKASAIENLIVSISGPLINLCLGIAFYTIYRYLGSKHEFLKLAMIFNLILFGLNILPIPGFDGWHVLYSLLQILA